MTWSTPHVFVAGETVTAATMNTYISNNLTEQFPLGDTWVGYTPTIGAGSGAFTTVAAYGQYMVVGKTMFLHIDVSITTNGTAAGSVTATLPGGYSTPIAHAIFGRADGVSGKALGGHVLTSTVTIANYDNTYPGANGEVLRVDAVIKVN
jgi:hypothetical protein